MDTRTPYRYLPDTKICFSILTPWASRRELYPSFIPSPNFPSSKLGYHVRLRATGYVYFLQVPVPSVEVIKTKTMSLVQSPIISKRTSSIEKSHPSSRIRLREWNVYHRHRLIRFRQASMTGYQNDRWRLEAIYGWCSNTIFHAHVSVLAVEYSFRSYSATSIPAGKDTVLPSKVSGVSDDANHPFCWADQRVTRTVTFSCSNCAFNGTCDGAPKLKAGRWSTTLTSALPPMDTALVNPTAITQPLLRI